MPIAPRTRRLLLLLALAAAAAGLVRFAESRGWGPWKDPAAVDETGRRPIGSRTYGRYLALEAGGAIDPAALSERARNLSEELETRLDERARLLDPGASDWRAVYARLQDDTPATQDAILDLYRQETARALEFCRQQDLVPLPAAPPRVFVIENAALRRLFPLAMNRGDGTLGVTLEPPPGEGDATTYRRNHCRVCVPPIAIHETYPGHHVDFGLARPGQGRTDSGLWPYFHEGWAQYGEILMWEQGYWHEDPALEMGALHLMLLRTIRAEVDAELHSGRIDAETARRIYVERLLIDDAAAGGEVAGHLQSPGNKASYLVGALEILALRDALGSPRGPALRSFHERLLRRPASLVEVARDEFGVVIDALPSRGLFGPEPASTTLPAPTLEPRNDTP